jgi:hypothetical protein
MCIRYRNKREATIELAGNWYNYGTIKIAEAIGYIYIKTNTQK